MYAIRSYYGERGLDNGVVEYKSRRDGSKVEVAIDEVVASIKAKP